MVAGRPMMYETVEELQSAIDEYFEVKCAPTIIGDSDKWQQNPPTVSGLALHLGFADRQSIYDYKEREEFSCTIKRAITRIEEYAEKQILSGGQATGAIFWLKNKGWVDKVVNENTGDQSLNITVRREVVDAKGD